MKNFNEIASMIALWLLVVFGLGALFAGLEMWLWNQVMPEVFGLKEITLWQALCISWLSMMLFKNMTPASGKTEESVNRMEQLHCDLMDHGGALNQIRDLHDAQVSSLDDIKGLLVDINHLLERQR